MNRFYIGLSLCFVSLPSFSCELYQVNGERESVMFHSSNGVCFSLLEGVEYTVDKIDSITEIANEQPKPETSYWSDWVLKTETDPLITQSLAHSYFGIGVWMPSQLEERFSSMTTQEWIMNHGLQFSLGFGERRIGEPRLRLDYRWHDKLDGDMMMQVELPF
ncbi:hypothetical protein [Vibrio sp. TRT 17S01]|uniref:hypothetical protein n=1 Tax=Vibrio sp. TRT 17S01 TaxID=3418505 RepID=UPI003CE815F6